MSTYQVPVRKWHGVPLAPTTRLGRWAVALAVVSGVGCLVALSAVVFADTGAGWASSASSRVHVRDRRLDRCVPRNGQARRASPERLSRLRAGLLHRAQLRARFPLRELRAIAVDSGP